MKVKTLIGVDTPDGHVVHTVIEKNIQLLAYTHTWRLSRNNTENKRGGNETEQ